MSDTRPPMAQPRHEPTTIDSDGVIVDVGTAVALNQSEINQQVATAHRFPRSVKQFIADARDMATLNIKVAEECFYALPRDGKTVEGPSARLAEIIASAWGNCRAGARVVSEDGEFVTAQGVFHDLQKNVAITYEVKRRIVNKHGKRFSTDMIGVTGNAASSIALRNAILKGVPKAFWNDIYEECRQIAMGDVKTLANRRGEAMKLFLRYGVKPEQIFALLGVKGEEDISNEMLLTLRGVATAIKDGETSPEDAFPPLQTAQPRGADGRAATAPEAPQEHQEPPAKEAPPAAPSIAKKAVKPAPVQQEEPPPANEADYGGQKPDQQAQSAAPPANQTTAEPKKEWDW